MRIAKLLINMLIMLIVAFVIVLAFHRTNQFEEKLNSISKGLWEHHPEIMQEESTKDYFPSGTFKNMTVTAQVDKELLTISACILIVLIAGNIILEFYAGRTKQRRTDSEKAH